MSKKQEDQKYEKNLDDLTDEELSKLMRDLADIADERGIKKKPPPPEPKYAFCVDCGRHYTKTEFDKMKSCIFGLLTFLRIT